MNCTFPKEQLALYAEGDLERGQTLSLERHLAVCAECRQFSEEIDRSQRTFKSLRLDTPTADALAEVRSRVLAQTRDGAQSLGAAIRLERFLWLGVRPRYALAGLAFLIVVSAWIVGQIGGHFRAPEAPTAAVFHGNALMRPDGYRDWVLVGHAMGRDDSPHGPSAYGVEVSHNVYMAPATYREYSRTGKFPEGAMMVMEIASAETRPDASPFTDLQASVKNTGRFPGGWGYFEFTAGGAQKASVEASPESAGCRSCHEKHGGGDQVFTQFYPVLRVVGAIMTPYLREISQ
jgi:hypothetical protein